MNSPYYNTEISTTVRDPNTKKLYRISLRNDVPYVTYRRRTRVLFANPVGGSAYINVKHVRVYFV